MKYGVYPQVTVDQVGTCYNTYGSLLSRQDLIEHPIEFGIRNRRTAQETWKRADSCYNKKADEV